MTLRNPPTQRHHPVEEQDLGVISLGRVIEIVIPALMQVPGSRQLEKDIERCLSRQMPPLLTTQFRGRAIARTHPLEGTQVRGGPEGNLADRYGIRNRGVLLETEEGKVWVIKLFQHAGQWCIFTSRFGESERNLHQAAA